MRARNIKPGFFVSEQLAQVPPLTRILFAGLWLLADRDGKLRDRPTRIRAEVLPYEYDYDADFGLADLSGVGLILRYEVGDERYIKILGFSKHQNPHPREVPSEIPEPNPGTAQATPRTRPAGLIPGSSDSPSLIPGSSDSPISLASQALAASRETAADSPPEKEAESAQLEILAPTAKADGEEGAQPPANIAPPPPKLSKKSNGTDPRFAPLRAAFEAEFLSAIGKAYRWQWPKDTKALHRLIAVPLEEFRQKARAGLKANGYAFSATVTELERKWNDITAAAFAVGPTRDATGLLLNLDGPPSPPVCEPWEYVLSKYESNGGRETARYLRESVTASIDGGALRLSVPDDLRREYVERHLDDISRLAERSVRNILSVRVEVQACQP